jgi:23S rRNA pseudouridine2605 synthase
MRISSYLAKTGSGSRRSVEGLIEKGLVSVNGKIVTDFSYDIKPADTVLVSGNKVSLPKNTYYLLNKPVGYTCSLSDRHAKKLITELVPEQPKVWPVGRLDRETAGLIILTNDGGLTQVLTHPKYLKEKEYSVLTDESLNPKELSKLAQGVTLSDGFIRPDSIRQVGKNSYQVVIHQGRNRIVRRSFEHFDKKVVALTRVRIGNICLDGLPTGKWRALAEKEISGLKHV